MLHASPAHEQVLLFKTITVRETPTARGGSAGPGTTESYASGGIGSHGSPMRASHGMSSGSPCSTHSHSRELFETWMILGAALTLYACPATA